MRRPTIADIARECGVSSTAVSFALNGRPGISEERRRQIQDVAARLGWTPSAAARALATSRVDAIGLVITAPFTTLARDTFYLQLIAGIEKALAETPVVLVLKMVESLDAEVEAIRAWHAQRRVDAVILVNPREQDPRPDLVREIGMRAVFLGDPPPESGASSVFVDDAQTMRLLLRDVAALGCRSLAYLHSSVTAAYRHEGQRLEALADTDEIAVTVSPACDGGDPRGGPSVAARIDELVLGGVPDLVLCEDETITLAALSRLSEHGLRVPEDLGLISWESSPGLAYRRPAISSIDRDPMILGQAAVEVLDELRTADAPIRRVIDPPRLVLRDSLVRRPAHDAPPADAAPVVSAPADISAGSRSDA